MNRALSWGSTGWNPGSMPTSNSEYGRAILAANGNPNANTNNATSVYVAGSPVFTPGQAHSPGCVHYGAGGGQTTGSYAKTGRGGVYGTGGNSSTDFEVLTGDAATAVLDRSNYQHGANIYNYSMPAQGTGAEAAGNDSSAPSAETGAGEGSGSAAYASVNGRQIQGTNMPSGDYAPINAGQQQQQQQGASGMVPATGLRMAKPPRYMTTNPTMPHVYSSVRAAMKGKDPTPNFVLCGKCIKCKKLQDPGALTPANTNFKNQGRTPFGSTRFSMPKATTSTPELNQSRPTTSTSAFAATGKLLKKDSRQVITPANQTGSLTKM